MGSCLAARRVAAGLTQQALAKRLRKPQSFVSAYEAGQRRIDLMEFLAIADAIGADAQDVFAEIIRRRARKPR